MGLIIVLGAAAFVLVWIVCGAVNHILCAYMFGVRQTKAETSFLALLGPIGTALLLLALVAQLFLELCARLSKRILCRRKP